MDRSPDVMTGRPPARRTSARPAPGLSSDEIQREIAETRTDMSETLGALRRRLHPGQVARAGGRRLRKSPAVRNLLDLAQDYPVPTAVVTATIGWFALRLMVRMLR